MKHTKLTSLLTITSLLLTGSVSLKKTITTMAAFAAIYGPGVAGAHTASTIKQGFWSQPSDCMITQELATRLDGLVNWKNSDDTTTPMDPKLRIVQVGNKVILEFHYEDDRDKSLRDRIIGDIDDHTLHAELKFDHWSQVYDAEIIGVVDNDGDSIHFHFYRTNHWRFEYEGEDKEFDCVDGFGGFGRRCSEISIVTLGYNPKSGSNEGVGTWFKWTNSCGGTLTWQSSDESDAGTD